MTLPTNQKQHRESRGMPLRGLARQAQRSMMDALPLAAEPDLGQAARAVCVAGGALANGGGER